MLSRFLSTLADIVHTPQLRRKLLFTAGILAIFRLLAHVPVPAVDIAAALHDKPVLRVDAPMAERAIAAGNRIGVLATLSTTLDPTVALVRRTAAEMSKHVEVVEHLCEGAFEAVMAGDTATHDRVVGTAIRETMKGVDAILLAQASMARVLDSLRPEEIPAPVFTSPELGVERARDVLERLAA